MSLLDNITNIGFFRLYPWYFVCLLIVIVFVKTIFFLSGRSNGHLSLSELLTRSESKWVLAIAFVLFFITVTQISGKGMDSWYLIYIVNYMRTNGIRIGLLTDRPMVSLATYFIGVTLNVPSELSVPIAGVIFLLMYLVSLFILVDLLTENRSIATLSCLLAVNTHSLKQFASCFIWNGLGLALLNLFFATVIIFYKSKEKSFKYVLLSMGILTVLFFTHIFTVIVGIAILGCFSLLDVLSKRRINSRMLLLTICCVITVGIFFLVQPLYVDVINLQTYRFIDFTSIWTFKFINGLRNDWNSDYIWIFIFSIIGVTRVLWNKDRTSLFLTSWIITVLATLMVAARGAGRIYLYLPLSILSVIGIEQVLQFVKKYSNHGNNLRLIFIGFLVVAPCIMFGRTAHMFRRYYESGPFYWDTQYVEQEQLTYIKENFNLTDIVVVTDVPLEQRTDIKGGFLYRLLSYVGNNVYMGKLGGLFEGEPDSRQDKVKTIYLSGYPGYYSSLNVDWILGNKTVVVASTIYNIQPMEAEILRETPWKGIFIVENLTTNEKLDWLRKWDDEF